MLAFAVCLVTLFAQGSLDEVVARIRSERNAETQRRLAAVEALTKITTTAAKKAALSLFEQETDTEIAPLLLEHTFGLPGRDAAMLAILEKGKVMAVRRVAARYFAVVHGDEGIGLLVNLMREKLDRDLHIACLTAIGEASGETAETAFEGEFKVAASPVRLAVLRGLRGYTGPHLMRVRRAALRDSFDKLRGEAIFQLVSMGDKRAIATARKLAKGRVDRAVAPLLFEALASASDVDDFAILGRLLRQDSAGMREAVERVVPRLSKVPGVLDWAKGKGSRGGSDARRFAFRLLREVPFADAADAFYAMTDDSDVDLSLRALFELAHNKDRRCVPRLVDMLDNGNKEAKLDALEALDLIDGDKQEYHDRLMKLVAAGPVWMRLTALDLAARHKLTGLLDYLPSLIKHRDWRMRIAAARAATMVRDKSMVPRLIDQLAREDGRPAQEFRDSLASLTRLYFYDVSRWKAWWKKEGEGFVVPPPPEKPKEPPDDRERGDTKAVFYGIPVESKNVVFCLDVSGSMNQRPGGTGLSRLQKARRALLKALADCPSQTLVNVVFFDTEVHPYSKRMIKVSNKRKYRKLVDFINTRTALGATNIHGALVRALADDRVDTVFVLSDGEPSAGEITDVDALARDILRRNRYRRVVFQCVSVGEDSPLLQRLASATGGRYVKR